MEIKDLKEGNQIKIKGKKYEVVKIMKESDYNPHKEPKIRDYLLLQLHLINSESILPNAELRLYEDTKELFFSDATRLSSDEVVIV